MAKNKTRAAIEKKQLTRLNELLRAIAGKNHFYADRIRDAGLDNGASSLDEFTSRIPFTTKTELAGDQEQNPPYGTTHTYALDRYMRFHQTSGTTRKPLHWLDTPESWRWVVGNWKRVLREMEVTRHTRIFFAFSFGPFLGFWSALDAAQEIGCLCIPGGSLGSESRLELMRVHKADVLCCTPTYALRLADVAREKQIPLEEFSVQKIIVAGEPGGSVPAVRQRIESGWPGARVLDHHGMTEVGPVSYECPSHPGILHAIEESYLVEIIHPETGAPVEEGGMGELVLTTLGRAACPLLRYRTGDLVKPSWKGKPVFGSDDLAFVGGIIGRIDDMVVVRGVNVYPSAVDELVRSIEGVAEYRVLVKNQKAMTELQIEIEAQPGRDAQVVAAALEETFGKQYHLRVPVTVTAPGSLPRFEMKAKRWVKES